VFYRQRSGGGFATQPFNTHRLLTTMTITGDTLVALDVPRAYLRGAITIGGAPPEYGAVLVFEDAATGDAFSVTVGASGAFASPSGGSSVPVAPGTYKVFYRQRSGGGHATQPFNTHRLLTTMTITGDTLVALDVPRAYLTAAITIGGGAPEYGAVLVFEDTGSDDAFSTTVSASGAFASPSGGTIVPVARGTYQVFYRQRAGGGYATQPFNAHHPLGCFTMP
jgi:hypothetical protein